MALNPLMAMLLANSNIPTSDSTTSTPPTPAVPLRQLPLNLGMAKGLASLNRPPATPIPNVINLSDTREKDSATGQMLNEKNRMSTKVNKDIALKIISAAKKYGVDPTTALSIGLNETGLRPQSSYLGSDNFFQLNSGDELPNKEPLHESLKKNGNIETFMKVFKHKMDYAAKLGKKNEDEMIQGYNGYGVIKNAGNLYGIDTFKQPIDFSKNPIYGKKILDIRENIIKKNPHLMALINQQASN